MHKRTTTLLGLLGAIVICAVYAQSASAEGGAWWIEGKLFKGTAEIAETPEMITRFKLEMHGEVPTFTIECEGLTHKHASIEGLDERTDEADIFEHCFAVGKPECQVFNTSASPLIAVIEGGPGAYKLKFRPQSGTEIAQWVVEGAGCAEDGSYFEDGTMVCNYGKVEKEAEAHLLEFTSTSGSEVEVNGSRSAFSVTYEDRLASGELWSVR